MSLHRVPTIDVVPNEDGGGIVVRVAGDIDMSNCDDFVALLNDREVVSATSVVLSLVKCSYMDSTCVSAIVNAHRRLPAGLGIVVRSKSAPEKILEVSGLTSFFTSFQAVGESKPSVSGQF